MKRNHLLTLVLLVVACMTLPASADMTTGMTSGKADLKSAGPLAFGPDGVLFVADTKSAAIFAIATGDTSPGAAQSLVKVDGINNKIAAMLGTAANQVTINDMAVNPISRTAYLSISRGVGPEAVPVLMRVKSGGELEVVALDNVKFSRAELTNAPADATTGQGNRARNPRTESITDVAFLNNRVIVAGLSNEEFASSLRSIPFPFSAVEKPTAVEMYHGAHGAFETRSPVRTFVSYKVGQEAQLLAAYTCTPLVQFPLNDLKPGAKIMGKTIAEFGAGNRPLDMIVYQKDGKDFLLLSNSAHGVMKIPTTDIDKAASITQRVQGTSGLSFERVQNWTGVDQLDRLDGQYAVVVRRAEGGAMNLESLALP
jgi:hypothetical protein